MNETLCWYCKNPGTGRCCWDVDLTPVPGWIAEKTRVDNFDTFRVIKCPLFVLDGRSMGPLIKLIKREVTR